MSRVSPALVALFVTAVGCEKAGPVNAPVSSEPGDAGALASRVTARVKHAVCPAPAPMKVDMMLGGSCAADSDCTSGMRPRCVHTPTLVGPGKPKPGPDVRACVADACETDADCAAGQLCFCGVGMVGTNLCDESGCHDDADCGGAPSSCAMDSVSAPLPPSSLPPPLHVPHYCRSAADECTSGTECKSQVCAFDRRKARFACAP
jgi:hypothetical protein